MVASQTIAVLYYANLVEFAVKRVKNCLPIKEHAYTYIPKETLVSLLMDPLSEELTFNIDVALQVDAINTKAKQMLQHFSTDIREMIEDVILIQV